MEVRDANEVAPYQALAHYFEGGSAALGTDFFRYAMQAKGLGYWVDLDLYFIRPIDFEDEYVFGWEHETSINGAVLRLPANSDMVRRAVRDPASELAAAFLRPTKDGDLLLEEADRRRHPAGELPVGHIRTDVPDVSGEEVRRGAAGKGALRLLSGHSSPLEIALRSAGARQSRADQGNEDGPPLALGIDSGHGTLASARVLSRGALSRSRPAVDGPDRRRGPKSRSPASAAALQRA